MALVSIYSSLPHGSYVWFRLYNECVIGLKYSRINRSLTVLFSKVLFFVPCPLLVFMSMYCLLIIYWAVGSAQIRKLLSPRPRVWTPQGNRLSFQCRRKQFSALLDLGSTQLPIQWTRVFFTCGYCGKGV